MNTYQEHVLGTYTHMSIHLEKEQRVKEKNKILLTSLTFDHDGKT